MWPRLTNASAGTEEKTGGTGNGDTNGGGKGTCDENGGAYMGIGEIDGDRRIGEGQTQSREPNRIQHRLLMSPEEITKALTDDIAKHASLLPFFCKKPASLESDMYVGSSPQLYFKNPPPQITKQIAETLLPTFSFTRHPNRMRGSITYIHTYIHT